MKDKLPPSIFQHGKIGFDIPAHDWLRGPLRPMLEGTLREGIRDYGELFRGDMIQNLAKQHATREVNAGYQLWGLLILFQWLKKWNVQAAASPSASAVAPAKVETVA
jgi:asparagine synthase (glutamine-hydrolysing)